MVRWLAFCFFLLYFSIGLSQNVALIKKIKQDLATAKPKDQFTLLGDLAWEYRVSNPDSSIIYATKAYTLGQSLNIKKALARPLNFIGVAHSHSGDNLDAFEYYNKAAAVATMQSDSVNLAFAYNNMGRLFTDQGLFEKSRSYLNQSLSLFAAIRDSSGIAYTFQSLGALNKLQNDFTQAEVNYKNAYAIRLHLKNTRDVMTAMIHLGKLYLDEGKSDQAIDYFQLADSAGRVINDGIGIAEVKTLLAECLLNQGNLVEAERMSKEGLNFILGSSNVRLLPDAYLTMGRVQFKKGDLVQAKNYFEKALEISATRKDLNARMEAHFFLWQTYRQQNNKSEELINHNQYLILRDSLKTLEINQQEQKFQFEREIQKKEQEFELLKARETRQNYIILALIAMMLSAGWLLYAQWKHRKRIQRFSGRLEERNGEIKKVNALLNLKNDTLENHINTLLNFSRNRSISIGNLANAAKDIAKTTAQNLNVDRVSIWNYHEAEQTIESMVCYELQNDRFLPTVKLNLADTPSYFDALKKEKVIVANDAMTNQYTKEFKDNYLMPLDIHSMLDSTFFLDGELKGLLCCEQKGAQRVWSAEDIIFVSSIADIISLAFRTAQRLEYEKQIKQQSREIALMNEVLEERVKERTEELKLQNGKLAEYAFINSHLLRGPLSRILGLINLMEHDHTMKKEVIIELLRKSGSELDEVVRKITDTLHQGGHLTRDDLK